MRFGWRGSEREHLRRRRTAGVRTLVDGEAQAGKGQVVWDGRDASGAAVASGIYLYLVKFIGANITEKMALVK